MCGLKTFLAATAMICGQMTLPVAAMPASSDDPATTFAACAGRLSAMMEHQWITDPPASERTEAVRARMIDLLEAAMRPGTGNDILNLRIEAKMAQAQLLSRARYRDRPGEAARALGRAQSQVAACEALLL
ncbi:MAG: hypothetical protein ACU0DK_15965 [Pseudooceanicola sp.]